MRLKGELVKRNPEAPTKYAKIDISAEELAGQISHDDLINITTAKCKEIKGEPKEPQYCCCGEIELKDGVKVVGNTVHCKTKPCYITDNPKCILQNEYGFKAKMCRGTERQ